MRNGAPRTLTAAPRGDWVPTALSDSADKSRRVTPEGAPLTTLSLDSIADSRGRVAVLAMDQRGTLRRMLDAAGKPSADSDLIAFKIDVVRALAPLSTGVLLDPDFGAGHVRDAGA